jgi:leucyl aminopeptidase (aminopeptidase T)
MPKNKEVKKSNIVNGDTSYNPNITEEEVFTSPVKIGNKEYIIKSLSMLDIKKLNIEKRKVKKEDEVTVYDYSFYTLLHVIKKFNPEAKDLTIDDFEDMIDVDDFERVQKAIVQIAGLKKYFKPGDSKK